MVIRSLGGAVAGLPKTDVQTIYGKPTAVEVVQPACFRRVLPEISLHLLIDHLSVKIKVTFDSERFCTSHSFRRAIINVSPLVTAS